LLWILVAATVGWELFLRHQEREQTRALQAAQAGDIRMISSESCVFCARARDWFVRNEVRFGECFIEKDPQCMADYQALNSPGTPLLVVKGQVQLGFAPGRVAQALAPAAAP
jgi:glutaredoxin